MVAQAMTSFTQPMHLVLAERLRPQGMALTTLRFDPARLDASLAAQVRVPGGPCPERAAQKRLAEFTAGQLCARQALQMLGWSDALPGRAERQAVWPDGVVGSISHSDQLACAVVAARERWTSVGVDVETLMRADQAAELSGHILAPGEAALAPTSLPFAHFLTLTFSAKEAAYKALYPLYGQFVDFPEVRLTAHDWDARRFRLEPVGAQPAWAGWLQRMEGVFEWVEEGVVTVVWCAT